MARHATPEHLGAFLVECGAIDWPALERANRAARTAGERSDRVLTKLGLIAETDLATALSEYLSLPLALPAQVPAEPVLADAVGVEFIRRNRMMPLAAGEGALAVGLTDPFNDEPVRALAYLTGLEVQPHLFAPADFERAFEALYVTPLNGASNPGSDAVAASEIDVQRLRDMASEAPTIRLVNQIITTAVEAGASFLCLTAYCDCVTPVALTRSR